MTPGKLKQEIRKHTLEFAKRNRISIDESHESAIIFYDIKDNFHHESYENIINNKEWEKRLQKPHQKLKDVKEMQSSNSSDALLMNIFCHPSINKWKGLKDLFGAEIESLCFGHPGRVSLKDGKKDGTEIDMSFSDVFCEAKLTENDFTTKHKSIVENYSRFDETFNIEYLKRKNDEYHNYQIIRNILASREYNKRHVLICDERRADLIREYLNTVSCLHDMEIRIKCRVIFWQEIAEKCGESLREWIKEKYGIM